MPVALLTWMAAWLLGQVVAFVVYSAGGYEDLDEVPIWVLFVSQLLIWGIFLAGMVLASPRGEPADSTGLPGPRPGRRRARRADRRAQQLILLLGLPLERLWEDVFTEEAARRTPRTSSIGRPAGR